MAQTLRDVEQVKAQQHDEKSVLQLVLTACSIIGIEGTSAFGQIYSFMTLEYLGIPTSMASLNGVVGGCSSTFLIPFLGLLTDKGDNPKKRKMVALLLGTLVLMGSLSCLLLAAVIKIKDKMDSSMPGTRNATSYNNKQSPTLSTLSTECTYYHNCTDTYITTDPFIHLNAEDSKSQVIGLPVAGLLGLLGFSLLDLGFDLGNFVSRAFALEQTPVSQHNMVLKFVSFLAPISGGLVSMFGIFDVSSILSSVSTLDGTAAMLMIFAIFLMGVVIFSTLCSVLFSTRCASPRYNERTSSSAHSIGEKSHSFKAKDSSKHTQNNQLETRLELSHRPSVSSSDRENVADEEIETPNLTEGLSEKQKLLGHQENPSSEKNQRRYFEAKVLSAADNINFKETSLHNDKNETQNFKKASSANYNSNGRTSSNRVVKDRIEIIAETSQSKDSKKPHFLTKRLTILLLSTFASMLCMAPFTNYNSLSLAIGIYKGDPLAPVGSEAKRLYNDGLRKSALGNTIFYCSYLFTSVLNKKLVDFVGKKVFFFISQLLHASMTMTYIVVQREELYYAAMTTMGFFRWALFTIPYMMTNDFTNESMNVNKKDGLHGVSKAGRVVAIITILCPINYLIASAIMGTLIAQTGNVWVPLIYSSSGGFASVLFFLPLFFLN